MLRLAFTVPLAAACLLAGCDMLGMESAEKVAAVREADGRAIGGACRHAARAIEDCYALNKKADKAAIFAGWRDMNDYMRENKIEPVAPQVGAPVARESKSEAKGEVKSEAKAEAKAAEAKPEAESDSAPAAKTEKRPAKAGKVHAAD